MQYEEAEALALKYLDERIPTQSKPVAIMKDQTEETEDCWIFWYDSKAWVENKDRRHRLAGNSPLEVSKKDGHIRRVPRNTSDALRALYKERQERERSQ